MLFFIQIFDLLVHTLFRVFTDSAIIMIIVKLVLLSLSDFDIIDPLNTPVYLAMLLAVLTMRLVHPLYTYKMARHYDGSWEKASIKKLKRIKKGVMAWREMKLSHLKVGDIIKIKYCEVSPADILILDTSEQRYNDSIFKTNERKIKGQNRIRIKRAIRNMDLKHNTVDTKNPDYLNKLSKTLNGFIEYDPPSNSSKKFTGEFKLKNDPKIANVTDENILYCGSKLYSKEVIGMVLYTGNNTKIFQKNYIKLLGMARPIFKVSKTARYARWYSVLFLGVSFLLSSIFMIILYTQSDVISFLEYVESRTIGFSNLKKYIGLLSFLINFIPISMIVVQDFYCLLVSLIVKYRESDMIKDERLLEQEQILSAQSRISQLQMSNDKRRKRSPTMGKSSINHFMSNQNLHLQNQRDVSPEDQKNRTSRNIRIMHR